MDANSIRYQSGSDSDSESDDEKQKGKVNSNSLLQTVQVVGEVVIGEYSLERSRTSILTGRAYVRELLDVKTSKTRFYEVFRMPRGVFLALCSWLETGGHLRSTAKIDIEEQVAMFVWTVGHNASNRDVQERFQHSGEPVSR